MEAVETKNEDQDEHVYGTLEPVYMNYNGADDPERQSFFPWLFMGANCFQWCSGHRGLSTKSFLMSEDGARVTFYILASGCKNARRVRSQVQ